MGMRMYKRCKEGEAEEPGKKKKEGVEDGDEEEEVVPIKFVGIDGQQDGLKFSTWDCLWRGNCCCR